MIESDWIEDVLVLALKGRLDSVNAAAVEASITDQIKQGANRLVLDFSDVAYVSSAGLRVVLVVAKRLKEIGGRLVLIGLTPSVNEVFAISGFLQILTVCDDRQTALTKLSG
ncbi:MULTISPECIES: STAS domain-containing protein [unclassified Bosea (in: a-proteobacteria)]|uniref:STAS domain-containing protein n=1 Tax=unclassified Bosea (in: a-proteobacteria) TaxID=2653178 RepID=UPI00238AD9D7|nr:STAS domain-containing protein [Bosea sp. (in: a-proteobacteria)]MCP4735204.1 STAS domain-containing protein [Bosea sp. (in: a-proteobacteria)]